MSGQMCEIKDQDLNKIRFYHMEGCYHCTTAKEFLQAEIDSNQIILLPSYCAEGVQGFPHFVNPNNGKTLTGCPKSKEDLFERLDYKENFMMSSYPLYEHYTGDGYLQLKEDYGRGGFSPQQLCQINCTREAQNSGFTKDSWFYNTVRANCVERQRCSSLATVNSAPQTTQTTQPPQTLPPKTTQPRSCQQIQNDCYTAAANMFRGNLNESNRNNEYVDCVRRANCPSSENYEPESMPCYPVVEHMETVSTDVLYRHHTGGYSKLSNCWVKQPHYTA